MSIFRASVLFKFHNDACALIFQKSVETNKGLPAAMRLGSFVRATASIACL